MSQNPEVIDIDALIRKEQAERRKQIDWGRVHLEADKRPALPFIPNIGRWTRPEPRKAK